MRSIARCGSAEDSYTMKTIVISLSLLLLLLACGKTPGDPNRPGKNVVPGTSQPLSALPSGEGERADMSGKRKPSSRRDSPARWM
jgi:hypothetical protein